MEQGREIARIRRERPDLVEEYEQDCEATEAMRRVLHVTYPLGSGDPDLYKAFCWRFWELVRSEGAIGVVLPRSALSSAGTSAWRMAVLADGCYSDVTMTTNTGGWVFDDAEPRYTIGLVSIRRTSDPTSRHITLRGPFASRAAFDAGRSMP